MAEKLQPYTRPLDRLRRALRLQPNMQKEIERGLNTPTYGPYVEKMVLHGRDQVRAGVLDSTLVEKALSTASILFRSADENYRKGDHPLTGNSLAKHQANVLAGKIELVAPESATTVQESIMQVANADRLLQDPDVQATLAAINYGAFFRPETMASATRTLDKAEIDDLLTTAESSQEAMPHLTVSNWAIGQTVAGLYESLSQQPSGKLRVFDIGSGPGATIAAMTSSINNVNVPKKPELAITALEATPEFFNELVGFAQRDRGIAELNLNPVVHTERDGAISTIGALTAVQGDGLTALKNGNVLNDTDASDITVITANYSWHRLNSTTKMAIMKLFHDAPNAVFVIGDLAQNASTVNRRYFNLGVNGPLNCGNLGLSDKFEREGYSVVNLDTQKPASLDPRLANRISHEDKTNDGHLWIAHKGQLASQALNLITAS